MVDAESPEKTDVGDNGVDDVDCSEIMFLSSSLTPSGTLESTREDVTRHVFLSLSPLAVLSAVAA